jgi:hypothetical protein
MRLPVTMRKVILPLSVRPSLLPLGFRSGLREQTYPAGGDFYKSIVLNSIALKKRATQPSAMKGPVTPIPLGVSTGDLSVQSHVRRLSHENIPK